MLLNPTFVQLDLPVVSSGLSKTISAVGKGITVKVNPLLPVNLNLDRSTILSNRRPFTTDHLGTDGQRGFRRRIIVNIQTLRILIYSNVFQLSSLIPIVELVKMLKIR